MLETDQWLEAIAFINTKIEQNNQGIHLFSTILFPYGISIKAA